VSAGTEDMPASTSLRVAHIIGGGDTGGAMTYLLPLVSALRTEGCDARLICLGAGGLADEAAQRGLPCEVLPMRSAWDPRVLPDLRRRITVGSWDVIHTHGMRANLPVRAIVGSMRQRPALFTTVHSDLALDYVNATRSRAYVALDRLSAGVVDGFFCVTADFAAKLAARGVPKARIQVVGPGIDLPGKSASGTAPVVGTVARLVALKDIGLLLESARLLSERVPGLRVIVVGDGPERAALERQAASLGLGECVEFRGEIRPAWPVLRELQVYALTSVSEGAPLSVLEAMSMGLPIVATAVGGVPDMLDDGVSGFLVPRHEDRGLTAAALADRIATLLADPALRARMGVEGRRRAVEEFSTAAAAKKTLRCYRRVLVARSDDEGW
jgi:glycosyltransferase involved in cell wall biosynthesis